MLPVALYLARRSNAPSGNVVHAEEIEWADGRTAVPRHAVPEASEAVIEPGRTVASTEPRHVRAGLEVVASQRAASS